jgi:hypothetical protein
MALVNPIKLDETASCSTRLYVFLGGRDPYHSRSKLVAALDLLFKAIWGGSGKKKMGPSSL